MQHVANQVRKLDRVVTSATHRFHAAGWVALAYAVVAALFHSVFETRYLIGNLAVWHWLVLGAVVLLAARPMTLHAIRLAIESVSSVTKTLTWILVWVVFIVQFINVATRYGNDYVEADIYFGEAVSVAWQSFALIAILGFNYGIRDGVNPRIDFWWADFADKTKAWLDFTIHCLLLLPFTLMAMRLLWSYAAIALGQKRTGEWPDGWRLWEGWERAPDAGSLAVGPIKAMLFVAFALFGLQVIAEIIKTGFVIAGRHDLGEVKDQSAPMRIE